jgi:hypothetical protein
MVAIGIFLILMAILERKGLLLPKTGEAYIAGAHSGGLPETVILDIYMEDEKCRRSIEIDRLDLERWAKRDPRGKLLKVQYRKTSEKIFDVRVIG